MPLTAPPPAPNTLNPASFDEDSDNFLAWLVLFANALIQGYSLYLAGITATSVSNLTIGVGVQNLVVEAGKGFSPGMEIIIAYTAGPTNRMVGTVISYDDVTGALQVQITAIGGAGTQAAWTISPTSMADFDGQAFTSLILGGSVTETPHALAGTDIDPANGTIQYKTLAGNTTFTSSIAVGQMVTLILTKGAYTAAWPAGDWVYGDPTLSSTYPSVIVLFNVTGTLCGIYCGPLQ